MKQIALTLAFLFSLTAAASRGGDLRRMLLGFLTEEEVHPDSVFPHIRQMEAHLADVSDERERAVTYACLGYLYHTRQEYAQNTTNRVGTQAMADSLPDLARIDEWTYRDYQARAVHCFKAALADLDLLRHTPIKDWLPIVDRGRDDRFFGSDMLYPIYDAARRTVGQADGLPTADSLRHYYTLQGCPEAVILLGGKAEGTPMAAECYLRAAQQAGSDTARARILREGIARYPHYKRIGALQNMLRETEAPFFTLSDEAARAYYPGDTISWPYTARGVAELSYRIYKVPTCFDFDRLTGSAGLIPATAGGHTLAAVAGIKPALPVRLASPRDVGLYILAVEARTDCRYAQRKRAMQMAAFTVTRLALTRCELPDGRLRLIVNDRRSGKPVEGAEIIGYGTTDRRGILDIRPKERSQNLTVALAGDTLYPPAYYRRGMGHTRATVDTAQYVHLYTDRAIYRPGQTIQVTGLAYRRERLDEQVTAGRRLTLRLRGSDYKETARETVVTDELGTFACTFTLPADCRPGRFTLMTDGAYLGLSVEEYRRPTFTCEMDDAPAVQFPIDTLTLTGHAQTYTGLPVRQARVTARYHWRTPRWWLSRHTDFVEQRLDTLLTDSEGRFTLRIPVPDSTAVRQGLDLSVTADVLSPAGETQTAEFHTHLCSTPLRLTATIDKLQDRDHARPWQLRLLSSTGREVKDSVQWTMEIGQQRITTAKAPTCAPCLPSGRYTLRLTAVAHGDTARYEQPVILFSTTDDRLPVDTALWVYAPTDSTLQLGTSLPDATLYYMVTEGADTIFGTGLRTLAVPPGSSISVFLYRDGRAYTQTLTFPARLPRKQLNYRWITFRDKLQPGAKETWRIQFTRPDSTAAAANLMATLYDASLDALRPHAWEFYHRFPTFQPVYPFVSATPRMPYLNNGPSFGVKTVKVRDYTFTTLRADLFEARRPSFSISGTGHVLYKARAAANMVMMADRTETSAAPQEEPTDDTEESEAPRPTLRSDFAETAAFFPRLRTDAQGIATLTFTLPDNLTSYRLIGLAHTADMFTTLIGETITVRRPLMAELQLPRFLRRGDEATLTASLRNLGDTTQHIRATLHVLNAKSERTLLTRALTLTLAAQADTVLTFPYAVTDTADAIVVRWTAEGTTASDGEQRLLPVLTDEVTLTDTRALTFEGRGRHTVALDGLFPTANATRKKLTFLYTARPITLALESLPPLIRPQHDDVVSLAAAYYAGSVARHLGLGDSLATPLLLKDHLDRLRQLQLTDGSFAWYPGMRGSRFLTLEIAFLLTRQRLLTGQAPDDLLQPAVRYLREQRPRALSTDALRYLYIIGVQTTVPDSLLRPLERAELTLAPEDAALAAVVLHRAGRTKAARRYLAQATARLAHSPERGAYIEHRRGTATSIDRRLDIHCQIIEAVATVTPTDTVLLRDLRRYLLQQRRTQTWDTPITTANAVYALIEHKPSISKAEDVIYWNGKRIQETQVTLPPPPSGGGTGRGATLTIHKQTPDESWGGLFAQYTIPMAEAGAHSEGITLRREYSLTQLRRGDHLAARYVITVDRDYEFVRVHVPRPAALEPLDQRSGLQWQNGASYYRALYDDHTEYAFDALPRGTYVINEDFTATRTGRYQAGLTTATCVYAPEYSAHTQGLYVSIQ